MINPTRQDKIDLIQEKIGRKDYICPMTHVYRTVLNEITLQIVLKWKDENGGVWEYVGGISYCEKIVRLWDLSKSNLQDQSNECVDFIFNLVK